MSFRLKTVLGVALIEFALLSLLLWSGLDFMRTSALSEFRQRAESTVRAFSVATKNALITSDLAEIRSMTREMLNYPGVVYARVLDAQGRVAAAAGPAAALARRPHALPQTLDDLEHLEDGVLDAAADVAEAGTSFGRIELGVSAAALREQLDEARRFGIGLAVLEMLLVALFSWLLGAYLTRQLKDLSDASGTLAAGALGVQIPVRGRDELASTAASFNRMSASLAASYAELSAREQELRLRGQIIESTRVGTVIADATQPDNPMVFANPAFEHITGYAFDEVRGRNCRFLQGPDTDPQALLRIRTALAAGGQVHEQLLNYRKDGTPFWNDLQIMPIRDAAGRLTHFVALQSDVSERVRAQQALAAREAYLRQVLNSTHDGIVVVGAHGEVESVNAGAESMFGRRAEDVVGQGVAAMVGPAHRARFEALFASALPDGTDEAVGAERELEVGRVDGSLLWIAVRVAELPLDGPRRYIAVVHDITERKLGEIELRHAKDAAEDAANAKSEFLANMSHEIRTPMHGVLGSIEMLRDTPLAASQRRHLDTASSSATLLLGVIDEILDFSRLEAGKLNIESLEFDLRRTVEDVTTMLAQRAHARRIELACYIAPDVPDIVRGDPIRLRQVLVNLVGNALKFTERGEVVVSVQLVNAADAGPMLRFEVRDTGIGIREQDRARLFEPFTQADSSTSRRFGGSGLGLSISRRLVQLMDGTIGYDSQEGVGSTFWFTLPAIVPQERRRDTRPADFSGTAVLVVDDNATNRVILHRYLSAWGAQSGSAAGGTEALAKLQDAAASSRPYDVALLDLNMPGMDGYALVAAIQADPLLQSLPLIMLSSSVQDPARLAGLRVDVWLDKPVRQSDLHDAIATVLAQQRPPPPAPVLAARPMQFNGERVLFVEDNPVTGDVGLQMLRKRGLHVDLATDGEAAVAAIKRGHYEAVLMDIQMPRMDGYQATRAVREWEAQTGRRRLPIIALTAHALPADRERCLAAGMDDYVVKPYSSETVGTVVARWLAPPGLADAGSGAAALDPARLAEVRAAMGEQMLDLLRSVREALSTQVEALTSAMERGDAPAVSELVHRIKNTAGDIGAERLHALAAGIEKALAQQPASMLRLDEVGPVCAEALEALEHEMNVETG
jgi:two-component system, sensor histidine kinase and response regulator